VDRDRKRKLRANPEYVKKEKEANARRKLKKKKMTAPLLQSTESEHVIPLPEDEKNSLVQPQGTQVHTSPTVEHLQTSVDRPSPRCKRTSKKRINILTRALVQSDVTREGETHLNPIVAPTVPLSGPCPTVPLSGPWTKEKDRLAKALARQRPEYRAK